MAKMQNPGLMSSPLVSVETHKGKEWYRVRGNPRSIHELARQHVRDGNGKHWWNGAKWNSIPGQEWAELDSRGIADYPLALLKAAKATLPADRRRPSRATPAVTGAIWNTPAVLANLPMAAITRARTKLPPRDIKIGLSISGAMDAGTLAKAMAPLAKAINDYTKQGGAVTLTVFDCAFFWHPDGPIGAYVETRINAADDAAVAFALSPAFPRNVSYPLIAGFSPSPQDSLRVCRPAEFPIPGVTPLSGYGSDIMKEVQAIIATLKIE